MTDQQSKAREQAIKIRMLRAGVRQTDIAKLLHIKPQTVNKVLKGKTISNRVLQLLQDPRELVRLRKALARSRRGRTQLSRRLRKAA